MNTPAPTQAEVRFREARADDALCLGVLGLQVFLDTYATGGIRPTLAREVLAAFATETMAALLARPSGRLQVAEVDGHLIGFAQLAIGTPQPLVHAARPAELERLYVQEPFSRRGIGAALLRWAEQQAHAAGAERLWLTSWVHNRRAIAFYAAMGYVDRGLAWYEFEGERHENRVFDKALASR